MVRIDFQKLLEERRQEFLRQQKARDKCFGDGRHYGPQNLICFDSQWNGNYQCSSCGWVYSRTMTSEEIEPIKREMDKIRIRGLEYLPC